MYLKVSPINPWFRNIATDLQECQIERAIAEWRREDFMQIFDQVDPVSLESREQHLWLLALGILSLFAVGIALLMYPTVFSRPAALMVDSARETFFGFCVMAALAISYLVNRHLLISRLRKKTSQESASPEAA
jgi:hypothetical protein